MFTKFSFFCVNTPQGDEIKQDVRCFKIICTKPKMNQKRSGVVTGLGFAFGSSWIQVSLLMFN